MPQGGGHSGVVMSALDFRSEGQWSIMLPLCCFLRQETPTLSLSTQVYKWLPARYCWGNPAMV